ncbi:hypothetical protein PIB30_045664 [Stylosanthes scabra]|uniref:Uncharacterized protein n=1 Tax=Stylosanthes scabra TaxID=79078 RepID=A0ABU6QGS2_9FABA|nr:hypothetical protein [Stylosanthes scabra]
MACLRDPSHSQSQRGTRPPCRRSRKELRNTSTWRRHHNSENPSAENERGTIKEAEKSSERRNIRRERRRNNRNVVEKLAREGKLDRFIKSEGPSRRDNRRGDRANDRRSGDRPQDNNASRSEARHMYTISGGFAFGGSSKSSRKRHLK